jgi:hypothetical protein
MWIELKNDVIYDISYIEQICTSLISYLKNRIKIKIGYKLDFDSPHLISTRIRSKWLTLQ